MRAIEVPIRLLIIIVTFYDHHVFVQHMMCVNIVLFGIFLNTILDSSGERRITDGKPVHNSKRYMVYLLKAPLSLKGYGAWLCGGAIVSPLYIVTSAACIEDVQYMYAIAGYEKYVSSSNIDNDECTKNKKKKVTFTCVPKAYALAYDKVGKWSNVDIGVVKVESPYDFMDKSYEKYCSYMPNQIRINYESKYQQPGIDALVMGWGHAEIWRNANDTTDYNMPKLQYATTQIVNKTICQKAYENLPGMSEVIAKYMICTSRVGNIDDNGDLVNKSKPVAGGCGQWPFVELSYCEELPPPVTPEDDTRTNRDCPTRRHGICQNDHGGPLVSWVGSHEVLIGVASVFHLTPESKCTGPYLFTSTHCNGAFLDCIINSEKPLRRNICDRSAKERGFDFIRRVISWKNHPDGPAANEILRYRPVRPIRNG